MRRIDADALVEDFKNDLINSCMEALRGNPHDTILISDVIERVQDAPTITAETGKGWISIKDHLPEIRSDDKCSLGMYSDDVLAYFRNKQQRVVFLVLDEGGYYWSDPDNHCDYAFKQVTHWQPLPKSPKEG